jgi:hypothetical protein
MREVRIDRAPIDLLDRSPDRRDGGTQ